MTTQKPTLACKDRVKRSNGINRPPITADFAIMVHTTDRSGSMTSLKDAPTEGLMEFFNKLNELSNMGCKIHIAVCTFDDIFEVGYRGFYLDMTQA